MAAGFPTTVNPIMQNGLVPVFVDVELGTYNTTVERVAAAIGPRTRAIIMAHTLGNPFDGRARSPSWPRSTACGSSRTTATRWAPPTTAGRPAPSAT